MENFHALQIVFLHGASSCTHHGGRTGDSLAREGRLQIQELKHTSRSKNVLKQSLNNTVSSDRSYQMSQKKAELKDRKTPHVNFFQ